MCLGLVLGLVMFGFCFFVGVLVFCGGGGLFFGFRLVEFVVVFLVWVFGVGLVVVCFWFFVFLGFGVFFDCFLLILWWFRFYVFFVFRFWWLFFCCLLVFFVVDLCYFFGVSFGFC